MTKSECFHRAILFAVLTTFQSSIALAQSGASAVAANSASSSQDKVSGPSSDSAGIQEIVVTAEKRQSSVQHTPIAITAVSGDALQEKGITNVEQVGGIVPALTVVNEAGTTKINIRGLGLNSYGPGVEGAVAVYANGIYLAHAPEIGAQFLDVQRLEVLRGPQGTLYGRNSTGGAVNIIPKSPTDYFEAGGVISYGNYNHVLADGYVSGPVIPDILNARFAAEFERYDGTLHNVPNNEDYGGVLQGGFRVSADYTPADWVKLTLVGDYFHGDDTSVVNTYGGYGRTNAYAEELVPKAVNQKVAAAAASQIGTEVGLAITQLGGMANAVGPDGKSLDPSLLYQDTKPITQRTYWGGSATLDIDLGNNLSLKSISGYRNGQFRSLTDGDRTTAFLFNYEQGEEWRSASEEIQLLGSTEDLNWIVGGYYLNDAEPLIYYLLPTCCYGDYHPYGATSTNALAAFGQATYSITPELKLTVGGRYSYEIRTRTEFPDISSNAEILPNYVSFHKFTPKVTLQYEPTQDLTLYATVSNGFKSGGFIVTAGQGPVQPETLWDYEAGAKARFLDNRLQVNLSYYHYDYSNLQVPVNLGLTFATENAASAAVDGGEVEITALPTKNLKLSANAAIIDSRFEKYTTTDPIFPELGPLNLAGNQLPFNSKYAFYLEALYTLPLQDGSTVEFDADYNWRSKQYFDAFNQKNVYQGAVGLLDARIRYTPADARWYIEAYGKNLTDKFYYTQTSTDGEFFGEQILGERGLPRMYGLRFGFEY